MTDPLYLPYEQVLLLEPGREPCIDSIRASYAGPDGWSYDLWGTVGRYPEAMLERYTPRFHTVGELVEQLRALPQDARVRFQTDRGEVNWRGRAAVREWPRELARLDVPGPIVTLE